MREVSVLDIILKMLKVTIACFKGTMIHKSRYVTSYCIQMYHKKTQIRLLCILKVTWFHEIYVRIIRAAFW